MANTTISDLTQELLAGDVDSTNDWMEIDDVDANVTKRISPKELVVGGGALLAKFSGLAELLPTNLDGADLLAIHDTDVQVTKKTSVDQLTLETRAPDAPGATAAINQNIPAGSTTIPNIDSPSGEPADASKPYYLRLDNGVDSEDVVVVDRTDPARTLAAPTQFLHTAGAATVAFPGLATTPGSTGLMPASAHHKLEGIEKGADVTNTASVTAAGALLKDGSVAMTGALDMGAAAITNVDTVDGRDVSADGTKLDGIETGADVTDAANVAAAGAVMDADFAGTTTGTMRRTGAAAYAVRKDNLAAGAPPTVDDDDTQGYEVGSRWIVPGAGSFECLDASTGAAVWALSSAANPDEYLQTDGSVPMAGALDMDGNDISNLGAIDPDYAIFPESGGDQGGAANTVGLYAKDNGAGVSALYAQTDDAVVHKLTGPVPPITEAAAGRVLSDADHGRVILCTAAGGCAITVPDTVSPGLTVMLIQRGANPVTAAGSGTMVVTPAATFTATTAEAGSPMTLVVESSTVCNAFGDLAAA